MIFLFYLSCILDLIHLNAFPINDSSIVSYWENSTVSNTNSQVLKKGFYTLLVEEKQDTSIFKGDGHFIEGYMNCNLQRFCHYDSIYQNEYNSLEKKIKPISYQWIYYITVDSYMVITPEYKQEHFYLYGFELAMKDFPLIDGGDDIEVDLYNPISLDSIKSMFHAKDQDGNDCTSQILFESNYNQDHPSLGSYYIIAFFQNTIVIHKISVIDMDLPSIKLLNDSIEIEVGTQITTEEIIKQNFEVRDLTSIASIKVLNDSYQNSYDIVGNYAITCYAQDEYENYSESQTIYVKVVDYTPPTIQLKSKNSKIVSTKPLTNDEIIELLDIQDNYSKDIKTEVINNTIEENITLPYEIKISATDQYQNQTIVVFPYYIVEMTKPFLTVENGILVEMEKDYTNQELFNLMQNPLTKVNDKTYQYIHLINLSHPLTLEEIQKRYKITDDLDGSSIFCTFQSDYPTHPTIGKYILKINYFNALNECIEELHQIWVRDLISPTVKPKIGYYELDISSKWSENLFFDCFEFQDNLDLVLTDIHFIGLENLNAEGDYSIGCYVLDSSTNASNVAYINIHAYESIRSTILPYTMKLQRNDLTEKELLSQFFKDCSIQSGYQSLSLKTNFYNNKNGIYQAKLQVIYDEKKQDIYYFKIDLKIEVQTKSTPIYIYFSIGILFIFIVIGLVIYHKRANLN